MSRIEASNTWEEGLVMDLNPLSTPNKVLTDCVNGTFITYNGNEFSLQNDQGNYKLEYCRLSPNYIPVGVKEYGDILYIVSQNPLNDSVEIGSYPSPLMITTPNEKYNSSELNSIIKTQILDQDLKEKTYTELTKSTNGIVFNGSDYKLNPGDEYCLQVEGDKPPYKYETLEYRILDEDSNPHIVSDKITCDTTLDLKDFENVAWTVPGWLSIKTRLAELSISGINVRSFYVPKTESEIKTAHFALNLRINVNDEYLTKGDNSLLSQWCEGIANKALSDVRFRLYIEKESDGEIKSVFDQEFVEFGITDFQIQNFKDSLFLNECDWTEWYGNSKILWKNISGKIENLTSSDKVRVRVIPVLFEEQYDYRIIYDNLEQKLLFDLNAIEDNEWGLGSDLYQFFTNSDKTSQYIYTNITGPTISKFPVNLYADIYDLSGNLILQNHIFEDYSGIGENVLQIPFSSTFRPENIYIIKFKFAPSEKELNNFPTVTRFLITSEVFNDFTDVAIYDRDISFDAWLRQYWKHNTVDFNLTYKDIDVSKPLKTINEKIFENKDGLETDSDKRYFLGEKFNTFFSDKDPGLSDYILYRNGYQYRFEYKTDINITRLSGNLWDSFGVNYNLLKMDYSSNKKIPFTSSDTYKSDTISAYVETKCNYQKMNVPFEFANCDFLYFSDNLDKLTGKQNSGKLTDYLYEISFEVYGRKHKEGDEDKRTFKVSGEFLKNGKSIGDKYNFVKSVQGAGQFKAYTINDYLYNSIIDYNLPCMLVKCNYTLDGASANYHLLQTIMGGPNNGDISGDFIFHKENDCNLCVYYICFVDKDDKIPVLIPLCPNETGVEYFKTFCNKISVTLKDTYLSVYDRYILTVESKTHNDPRLTVYGNGLFNSLQYFGFNLKSQDVRNKIITSLYDKGLELRFDQIFTKEVDLQSAITNDSVVVFDKVLKNISFGQNSDPYIKINEISQMLTKLAANSNSDFEKWSNSTQLNDSNRLIGGIKGLYCDEMLIGEDALLAEMNSGYLESGTPTIYLSAKNFKADEGLTEKIATDWYGNFSTDYTWDKFKSLAKNRAMWFLEHNYDKGSYRSSGPSNSFVIFGGCLASDPDTRLDLRWKTWLTR